MHPTAASHILVEKQTELHQAERIVAHETSFRPVGPIGTTVKLDIETDMLPIIVVRFLPSRQLLTLN